MKKISKFLVPMFVVLLIALPVFSATNVMPSKNHSGKVGESGKSWYKSYVDYMYLTGGTAYAFKFTGTPSANRTITFPDASGTVVVNCGVSHDYAGGHADWTLTVAESACGYIETTNAAVGGANAILPSCVAGKLYVVYNTSGQTVTLKVAGQTGATVATSKKGFFVCTGTDVLQIYTTP